MILVEELLYLEDFGWTEEAVCRALPCSVNHAYSYPFPVG